MTPLTTYEVRSDNDAPRAIPTQIEVVRALEPGDVPVVDLFVHLGDGVTRHTPLPLDVAESLGKAISAAVRAQKKDPADADPELVV